MDEFSNAIKKSVSDQKAFYNTYETRNYKFRLNSLKQLRKSILLYEEELLNALWLDLRKSKFEAFSTEIGIVLKDLNYHIKNLRKWTKPKRVGSSIIHFKSKSYVYSEPFGNTLIIAPWNYPFLLLFGPLIGSVSAGNCTILKPSPYVPNVSRVFEKIIKQSFDEKYIDIFQGGRDVNSVLLEQQFDYMFFTGSTYLGKIVLTEAAKNLTPVTLELGGKSPCIVDRDAKLALAAKRIIWGKLLNAGQTCIAPDYLLVHEAVKKELINKMIGEIKKQWGTDILKNKNYPRIVNEANVERLRQLLDGETILTGGDYDIKEKYFAPTILDNVKEESNIMKEEIFGPILPVIGFSKTEDAINYVNSRPKPLAFYYFSKSRKKQKEILMKTSSGGGCINDTIMHIANHKLPFGGVGKSGMGRYHGKFSFDTFSNKRAIIKKAEWIDIPLRYNHTSFNLKIVRMLMKGWSGR